MLHTITYAAGIAALIGGASSALAAPTAALDSIETAGVCPGLAVDIDCNGIRREGPAGRPGSVAGTVCFDVDMAGLSGQAGPTSPFDGVAVTRIGGEMILVETSATPTGDLSDGYIESMRHTLTFPEDPGRSWDGVVVTTDDEVEPIPLTPGIHPLLGVLTAVEGATGVIRTTDGSFVDLTDEAGGRASWIVEGELCFEQEA